MNEAKKTILTGSEMEQKLKEIAQKGGGRVYTIVTCRQARLRAKYRDLDLKKQAIYQLRLGLSYENKADTKEKREEGISPGILRGRQAIGKSLYFSEKQNRFYVGGDPVKSDNSVKKSQFFLANSPVDKESIKDLVLSSEINKSKTSPDWVTVPIDTVVSISGNGETFELEGSHQENLKYFLESVN